MEQAAVAAINAHIGSLAVVSVSPELSLWTNFLWLSYGPDGASAASAAICCPLDSCAPSKMRGGSRTLTTFCSSPEQFQPAKLGETNRQCRVHVK